MRKFQCFVGSPLKLLSTSREIQRKTFLARSPCQQGCPAAGSIPVQGSTVMHRQECLTFRVTILASMLLAMAPMSGSPKWNPLMPRFRQEPSPLDGGRPIEDANCSVIVLQYKPEFRSPLAALPLRAFASLRLCFNGPGCRPGLYRNPKPCFHERTCNLE